MHYTVSKQFTFKDSVLEIFPEDEFLDPVVQSIVNLTISLRHKFVKQISAKVTNNSVFVILMFEILTKR